MNRKLSALWDYFSLSNNPSAEKHKKIKNKGVKSQREAKLNRKDVRESMVQTIPARKATLQELKTHFGLQLTTSYDFFPEWMDVSLELAPQEQQQLDRVKTNLLHLSEFPPLLENAVKMVVLSPLLDLAGFYAAPFCLQTEVPIEVTAQDEDTIIRGQIDVLIVQNQLWILAIESKNMGVGLSVGIPQALSYMLASPEETTPVFGMVTTGSEFVFLKLVRHPVPTYSTSRVFSTFSPINELYDVLKILKTLGAIATANAQ